MKGILCTALLAALLALTILSCEDTPTSVQNNDAPNSSPSALSRGADRVKPKILDLRVLNNATGNMTQDDPVTLPGTPAVIHYHVTDDVAITQVTIDIVYDAEKDNSWDMMFTPYLIHAVIPYDGTQKDITDDFVWDGTVPTQYSSSGQIFDQLASTNPDVYLVSFDVSDGQNHTQNWESQYLVGTCLGVGNRSRIFVNPSKPGDEFHITGIAITTVPSKTKKGVFTTEAFATITCNKAGFSVIGNWYSLVEGQWKPFGYWYWTDPQAGNPTFTTPGRLLAPGKYRYYARLLYSPNYSYAPQSNASELYDPSHVDGPYAEVTIQ